MAPTFVFTIEQIKQIFDAGRRQGENEATAYDWGSPRCNGAFDECVAEMYGIVNCDKQYDDEDYTDYSTVKEWFK